jgi:AcrR family transcriptional regulator
MSELATITLTDKAQRTRERIFETALMLFGEQGYEQTTMRDVAKAADCSLGLAYRYFESKEDIVFTLYERLAAEQAVQARNMPPAPLWQRFDRAMSAKLAGLQPYRDTFGALFWAALNPRSRVAVLGSGTSQIRKSVGDVFAAVVLGSTDAPRQAQAKQLASVLYSVHLGVILFWLYDPTPGQRATHQLLALIRDLLKPARRILRIPFASNALARLANAIEPVFGSGEQSA